MYRDDLQSDGWSRKRYEYAYDDYRSPIIPTSPHTPQTPHVTTPEPHSDDASLPTLWDAAWHLLDWLTTLFGNPAEFAQLDLLAPREQADILHWLRPLEALVRRLLLLEAAELAGGLAASHPSRRVRLRTRRLVAQDPENASAWRVSFRVTLLASQAGRVTPARALPSDLPSAWPIAERWEAVARVLAEPAPYARRLARRLKAKQERARPLAAPPKHRSKLGEWALEHALALAWPAVAVFDSG